MGICVAFEKVGQGQEGSSSTVRTSPMTDEALYDELIAPMERRMMRTIWRVVRQGELAEDALQDALTLIWRKRDRVRRHPNPEALILRMCLNCAYDALRKQERFRKLQDSSEPRPIDHAPNGNAVHLLEEKDVEAEVLGAIARLPRNQALAVLMRIVHDEPYDVIARAVGCSETTARIHVSRARQRLSERLAHLRAGSSRGSRNE